MRFHFIPIEMSSRFYRTKCLIKVKIFRYFLSRNFYKKTRPPKTGGRVARLI